MFSFLGQNQKLIFSVFELFFKILYICIFLYFNIFLRVCYVGLAPQHALSSCQRHQNCSLPYFLILEEQSEEKSFWKMRKHSKLSVPEGHCQVIIIEKFDDIGKASDHQGGTPDQRRNAWFWRRGPQGPLKTTRWSLFLHH